MLTPEQAKEQLKACRIEDGWQQRRDRAAKLPNELRTLGQTLTGRAPQGMRAVDHRAEQQALARAWNQLDALSSGDRQQVFEALFPGMGACVEHAWQIQMRLPYQLGWTAKAFRAPNTPQTTQPLRGSWLTRLASITQHYVEDVPWFAAWTPYLEREAYYAPYVLGILFAGAIEVGRQKGDQVFSILCASARGEHEIGAMGRHVVRALLVASRPEGWEFVEGLLLAAQRQEGLRQTILETIDMAHPEAFRRMLRLIREHNLARFSATVRAMNVWFGFEWDSAQARKVNHTLEQVLGFLDDRQARAAALDKGNSQELYLALWTYAFEDAIVASDLAAEKLDDPDVERRFVAAHLLAQLGLVRSSKALLSALDDEDLRVVARALQALQGDAQSLQDTDLFEQVEGVLGRLPKRKKTLEPIVWPWMTLQADPQAAAGILLTCRGNRRVKRLLAHLSAMDPYGRSSVAEELTKTARWDSDIRDTLLALIGDRSQWVREKALKALADKTITPGEAVYLEGLLARKAGDLRRGVISLLLNQKDPDALDSAERLLGASNTLQRQAGLDLLRQMADADRSAAQCRRRAQQYQGERTGIPDAEQALLDTLLNRDRETPTLDEALGLLDPTERTKPTPPKAKKRRLFGREKLLVTPAAIACLKSLDELIHEHRTTPIKLQTWQGEQEELLGNIQWGFPAPDPDTAPEKDVARLPLNDIWEAWWAQRPDALHDHDGFELLRAIAAYSAFQKPYFAGRYTLPPWLQKANKILFSSFETKQLKYPQIVASLLEWFLRLHPATGAPDFLLDNVETSFALVPKRELARVPEPRAYHDDPGWRSNSSLLGWLRLARRHRSLCPEAWQDAHHVRLWGLLRWMDEPGFPVPRYRPLLEEVMAAYQAGGATEADILDQLLGPRAAGGYGHGTRFRDLHELTGRKPPPIAEQHPILNELAIRCRARVVEVEMSRGDMPTEASRPALALRSAGGADVLFSLLKAMGRAKFIRGWTYDSLSKASTFSHLIRVTFPGKTDTLDDFSAQVKAYKVSQTRLIEVAVYAPQWARFVEHALDWPQFEEAVWWLHAHTKDTSWRVDPQIREVWNAQVQERTPLTGADLLDGAVDVAWFHRVYSALGPERWAALGKAAKYASGGGGHKRAQLFADAMLGQIEKEELLTRITEKRHKDVVRALGLLPLPEGQERDDVILERYQIIQEFLRTSRKFGSQRQASEKLAARIGLENLARTAGYPDPVRLEWAMEAREIADLADGPLTVVVDDVAVSLTINEWGEPVETVIKGKKRLKSIPARVRKSPNVKTLRERKRTIKRQASRMRHSLEWAMCRGDRFTGTELRELFDHPVLAPMLEQLVFLGEGIAGYPVERGQALQNHDGSLQPVGSTESLRLAHPHDLLATKEWHHWQRDCFLAERIQPFKQVFRELYVLTEAEKADGAISRRYAGHQVNPRQAMALLGSRGWVVRPEEGAQRTFHDEGISAWLVFLGGYFTPAEVEGLTIEGVQFARRGEWQPLELTEIPPRLFSEVMRDVDLAVSIAHRGGVDPEASASTVEMRATLIRETCALLKADNVRIQNSHALVEGQLSSYSVHLGSGVVHQQPGGHLCIVPVHAQHRGRIFLPFADDDPKTAEVLSKILLLARDNEIKDPTILEQILRK